ncbi:MAG: hypothetical protein EAX90_07855 [Candidatus Heimdallarchaeota archaeon]|nr:hypothetical protein [Candidatus Heimdallarchaeota archaeon]
MKTKLVTKVVAIFLLIVTLTPMMILTVHSETSDNSNMLFINTEDTKLYKVLLYKKGNLGNILSSDLYHFQMKANRTYLIKTKIDITEGLFSLAVTGPGGVYIKPGAWTNSDPADSRFIQFLFTPDESGDHSIAVAVAAAVDGGSYSLYINQDGFAGWWWILAVGIGFLLIVIIILVISLRASKKSKKKGKSKKRR